MTDLHLEQAKRHHRWKSWAGRLTAGRRTAKYASLISREMAANHCNRLFAEAGGQPAGPLSFLDAMDHATTSLKRILESGEYELVPNVPLFDQHDEFDESGNLVRRFGQDELQEICDRTNQRCEGGDLAILGLGHTIPRDPVTKKPAPESEQPAGIGYGANFKVGTFGPNEKTAILADLLIPKDKIAEARTYERRSIELWPKSKIIDWIALLRKAPQRDLGLLTYSRDAIQPFRPTRHYYGDAAKSHPLAMAVRGEKLFYSAEDFAMPMDPTKPADAAAPDADFVAKLDRYIAEKYPSLNRMHDEALNRYAAATDPNATGAPIGSEPPDPAGATPSATNGFIPGQDKNNDDKKKEKLRMAADTDAIRYARIEEELKTIKAERDAERAAAKRAKATQRVQAHQYAGYTLDCAREVERYCKMDEAEWDGEDAHIRQYYRQDSPGMVPMGGMFDVALPTRPSKNGDMTREQSVKAAGIATRDGISFDKAKQQVLAGV